jgi:glycosyltransferase involved in cell wall biosynthesis
MYNAELWIESCLKGLLAQTHTNFEVFCVDDASSDGTFDCIINNFGGDDRLCAIKLAKRVGPYQIKNWVISTLAHGDWIALQDADDVSHPQRLARQLAWMKTHRYRVSGTCTHQFFPAGLSLPLGHGMPLELDGMLHNLAFFPTVERAAEASKPSADARERAGEFWDACRAGPYKVYANVLADHGSQMLERALFDELGGFDGHTRFAGDSDFNQRAVRFCSIGNLPQVLYSRRFHALSLTQHPETSIDSPARIAYRARRKSRDAEIDAALAGGDTTRLRELCTSDGFWGDVEFAKVMRGWRENT